MTLTVTSCRGFARSFLTSIFWLFSKTLFSSGQGPNLKAFPEASIWCKNPHSFGCLHPISVTGMKSQRSFQHQVPAAAHPRGSRQCLRQLGQCPPCGRPTLDCLKKTSQLIPAGNDIAAASATSFLKAAICPLWLYPSNPCYLKMGALKRHLAPHFRVCFLTPSYLP